MPGSPRRRRTFKSRGSKSRVRTGPSRWKHGPIPVVGIVGGIGAGKSQASQALESRGAFLIDADRVGHALLEQTPCRELVLEQFGDQILSSNKAEPPDTPPSIDRKALGRLVFANQDARRDLEKILHPRMRKTFERAINRTIRLGRHQAVVLDAAILFEAGWDNLCDLVLYIDAPRETRLARLQESRGWTGSDLEKREASQWPLDRKRARANLVVPNAGTPEELDQAINRIWEKKLLAGTTSPARPAAGSSKPGPKPEPEADVSAP